MSANAEHTLKILRCTHNNIFKVYQVLVENPASERPNREYWKYFFYFVKATV